MLDPRAIDDATEILRQSAQVAVLTGAGISVESGLSTFRGSDGLWEGHHPADVATPRAFARDPRLVWRFYNHRRRAAFAAEPNVGHRALVDLAQARQTMIITQNVDRLHQRAGTKAIIELHGTLEEVRCTACGESSDRPGEVLPELPSCPDCGGLLRPAIVWFGEALPPGAIELAANVTRAADVLLVVGTSAVVYPAAGLVDIARRAGTRTIEVNPEPSGASVDIRLTGPASQVLPRLVEAL